MQQNRKIKPQLRKTKTDTTNYVDVQTGEILDTTQTHKEKLIGVNSSYTMLYNDAINSLVSLTPCAKSVIFVLISMYIRSGFFEIGNGLCSEMAVRTGYSIKSVRNSITELVSTGFIIKSGQRGLYIINPMCCYSGSLASRRKWIDYLLKEGYKLDM